MAYKMRVRQARIKSEFPDRSGLVTENMTSATADKVVGTTFKNVLVDENGEFVASAGPAGGANNGLDVDAGKIVLGQDVGEAGNPAALLSDREIPLNGNTLYVNGGGRKVSIGENGGRAQLQQGLVGGTQRRIDGTFMDIWDESGTPNNNPLIISNENGEGVEFRVGGTGLTGADGTGTRNAISAFYIDPQGDARLGGNAGGVPASPTGNGTKFYIQGNSGEDTVIDSGLDDYSGLVLSRLDTNTPATSGLVPLGVDSNGLVGIINRDAGIPVGSVVTDSGRNLNTGTWQFLQEYGDENNLVHITIPVLPAAPAGKKWVMQGSSQFSANYGFNFTGGNVQDVVSAQTFVTKNGSIAIGSNTGQRSSAGSIAKIYNTNAYNTDLSTSFMIDVASGDTIGMIIRCKYQLPVITTFAAGFYQSAVNGFISLMDS